MSTDNYATIMDRLKDPDSWDIRGIVADTTQRLLDDGDTEAAAVIDSLLFSLRDIHQLLVVGPKIDASSIGQACKITSKWFAQAELKR